jgi:exodeoxyribonuclease VII large subunit
MSRGPRQLFDPEAPPQVSPENSTLADPGEDGPDRLRGDRAQPEALSIGEVYAQVEGALAQAFPRNRPLWVRGEISHLSDHRSGHLYLDLVEPDDGGSGAGGAGGAGRTGGSGGRSRGGAPALQVKCWRSSWAPLRHNLAKQGIELAEGMVVVLRGTIDLYRAKGEISLILVEVDVSALLGQMAAQRAALLAALEAEGLIRANGSLAAPAVPLRVGLVASPGTEGCRDFLGQLTASGFSFEVSHVKVPVQGPGAPASIARALTMLGRSDCDVIAVVRGGGARADLAAFETELVARAVATCPKPVLTGIGHSGDETVADVVAARACITPTECGQHLVESVRRWWEARVAGPAAVLSQRVPAFLGAAKERDAQARRHLTAAARRQIDVHGERLRTKASAAARFAPRRVEACEATVRTDAARLGPLALGHLGRQDERLISWRRLLTAYDVDRQLERGYSLTLSASGALVRSASQVAVGDEIVTRFADGTARSRVEETQPGGGGGR